MTPLDFREDLEWTRMNGLSCGEESMTICSAVLIHYQRVTDRQTDRQMDVQPISITCFSIANARKNPSRFSRVIITTLYCHFLWFYWLCVIAPENAYPGRLTSTSCRSVESTGKRKVYNTVDKFVYITVVCGLTLSLQRVDSIVLYTGLRWFVSNSKQLTFCGNCKFWSQSNF